MFMTEQEWRDEFSHRLRRLAWQRKRYNQKMLAEASGISEVTICHYYNGTRTPKGDNLVRLSRAIGCTIDELIMVDEMIELNT